MFETRRGPHPAKQRREDELPLSLKELAQAIAVVAVLVLGVGTWLVGAGANKWAGIVLVAVGVGAIGGWYVLRRVPRAPEEEGE